MALMAAARHEKPTSILKRFSPLQRNTRAIKVWDHFVRFFHWGLVLSFAVAYFTADDWRDYHLLAGYAAAALVAARVVWGIVGTPYARFTQFVRSPAAIGVYISDVLRRSEARYIGHNPAGAVMILILLVLLIAVTISGWLLTIDLFWGSAAMERIHGVLADAAVVCIAVHVGGVIAMSIRQRENLIRSMITGWKRPPGAGDVA